MKVIAGIDVGGTNTDAVLVVSGKIIERVKVPTTPEVRDGILNALSRIRAAYQIERVHIGTTAFTNALVERRNLEAAAAIRVGAPVSESLPPMVDWPDDLRRASENPVFFAAGGREYDGRAITPIDRDEIASIAKALSARGVRQAAVTSVFGTSYPDDEVQVANWMRSEYPELEITLSHRIGRFGILERENATLLNAMLRPLAARTVSGFQAAVPVNLFISQNDGTAMRADSAARLPIFTVASGPTNSLRGAGILASLDEAIVIDVGGTTTDIGSLRLGFPREANNVVEIGGVRTLFRMPDLLSLGLGGGTMIQSAPALTIGPASVGYRLTEQGLVFGGDVLTVTDVAVAAGLIDLGDRARVALLPAGLVTEALARIRAMIEEGVDRMKTDAGDTPLIAVGGGSFLVPPRLAGVSEVLNVPHQSVANAVGAAIAQVSGEVDQIFQDLSREEAIARARRAAEDKAVAAGADRATINVVEVEDLPLAYLPGNSLRTRVRVVGEIAR